MLMIVVVICIVVDLVHLQLYSYKVTRALHVYSVGLRH